MNEYDGIELECVNCRRESHLFGIFCWWGVALILPVLLVYLAVFGLAIWTMVS